MKLPQIHYSQVESLGRHDTGGITVLAGAERQKGAVSQKAMQQLAGVAGDFIARQENKEYNDQMAAMSIELSEWEGRFNAKQFYTADDIVGLPDDIRRVITSSDDNGVLLSKVRDDIPAYEVYPHLLNQKMQGMIKEKADKITNPHLRNDFINKSEAVGAEKLMRASIAAEQAQQAYTLAEGKTDARAAADSGDLRTALFRVEQLEVSELERDQMVDEVELRVEIYDVVQASRSNNQETVMAMRSMLTDPQYSGNLSEAQRSAGISDLNSQLTILGLEGIEDRQTALDIRDNNRLYSAGLGNMTHEEVEEGYELWQDDPKHKDAISVDRRLQLHGAIDAYDSALAVEQRRLDSEAEAAQNKAEKEAYSQYYSNLNRALDNREITTHAQIESIYEMGLAPEGQSGPSLKPGDRTTMHRRLDTLNKDNQKIASYETTIAGALSGEYPLRRTNSDHVAAVEHFVDVKKLTRDSVEDLGKLTKLTGIMPDNLRDEIEGGLLSGNPDQGIASLQYIENLQRSDSHLTSVLSADTMDIANFANMMIRGGEDPAQALEKANTSFNDVTAEMRTHLKKAYKDAKIDNVKALGNFMDADDVFDYQYGPYSDVDIPYKMQAEFDAMVEQSYPFAHGSAALAQKLAYKNIKANWSVTGVGIGPLGGTGARASKLPPEKVLQISSKAANLGLDAWAESEGLSGENIGLVVTSDPGTLNDRGWTVWVYDLDTGYSDIHGNRWLADDWVKGAVATDDATSLLSAHEKMVGRGEDFLGSGRQLNTDRLSGRDLQ